jgi:branched-chain amino acid transport system substrate-binding protein
MKGAGCKRQAILAVMVSIVLMLPAVSGAASPEKLKVGFMFGLTGAASPVGPVQLDGAKLAVKDINAAGGVKLGGKKVPLEFVVRDDETKPDVAIRRFRELVEE